MACPFRYDDDDASMENEGGAESGEIQTRTYRPRMTRFVNATGVCEEGHLGSAEYVLNSRSQIARCMIGYANLIGMSVVDSSYAREIMIR